MYYTYPATQGWWGVMTNYQAGRGGGGGGACDSPGPATCGVSQRPARRRPRPSSGHLRPRPRPLHPPPHSQRQPPSPPAPLPRPRPRPSSLASSLAPPPGVPGCGGALPGGGQRGLRPPRSAPAPACRGHVTRPPAMPPPCPRRALPGRHLVPPRAWWGLPCVASPPRPARCGAGCRWRDAPRQRCRRRWECRAAADAASGPVDSACQGRRQSPAAQAPSQADARGVLLCAALGAAWFCVSRNRAGSPFLSLTVAATGPTADGEAAAHCPPSSFCA